MTIKDNVVSTTEISKALGILVTSRLLIDLGFKPALQRGNHRYWYRTDVPSMNYNLAGYLLLKMGALIEKYGTGETNETKR